MTRIRTLLVGATMASVAALALPVAAHAATGDFFYRTRHNVDKVLENPTNGACHSIAAVYTDPAKQVYNDTNRVALVYAHGKCVGEPITVKPAITKQGGPYLSVRFLHG